jgi:hypothetical protein
MLSLDERTERAVRFTRRWQEGARISDLARAAGVTHGTMTRWIHDGQLILAVRDAEKPLHTSTRKMR